MTERVPKNTNGIIAQQTSKAVTNPSPTAPKMAQTLNQIINGMCDAEGYRKRFDELLGSRAPQFISSIITLCNSDANLAAAVRESPNTVIQAGLKAAAYDLPVDNSLGFAYIVPFKNRKKLPSGEIVYATEAQFILGYKGMQQLAIRTGVYQRLNVMDVREGELVKLNRLTEDFEFQWIEDDEAREQLPIIGYVGYFRLVNGMEKTLFMSKSQIAAHEERNRKGQYMGKGWRDDWDAMARKTVMRRLLGRWGILSIDYKSASPAAIKAAENINAGMQDDELPPIDADIIVGDQPQENAPEGAEGQVSIGV